MKKLVMAWRWLGGLFIVGSLALLLGSCDLEPEPSMEIVEITIGKGEWETSFAIPRAYLFSPPNGRGGYQHAIFLMARMPDMIPESIAHRNWKQNRKPGDPEDDPGAYEALSIKIKPGEEYRTRRFQERSVRPPEVKKDWEEVHGLYYFGTRPNPVHRNGRSGIKYSKKENGEIVEQGVPLYEYYVPIETPDKIGLFIYCPHKISYPKGYCDLWRDFNSNVALEVQFYAPHLPRWQEISQHVERLVASLIQEPRPNSRQEDAS